MSTYGKRQMVLDALKVQAQDLFKAKTQAEKAISEDSVKFWETVLEQVDGNIASILVIGAEEGWCESVLLDYVEKCVQAQAENLDYIKERLVNVL